jgi:hypothetical protein
MVHAPLRALAHLEVAHEDRTAWEEFARGKGLPADEVLACEQVLRKWATDMRRLGLADTLTGIDPGSELEGLALDFLRLPLQRRGFKSTVKAVAHIQRKHSELSRQILGQVAQYLRLFQPRGSANPPDSVSAAARARETAAPEPSEAPVAADPAPIAEETHALGGARWGFDVDAFSLNGVKYCASEAGLKTLQLRLLRCFIEGGGSLNADQIRKGVYGRQRRSGGRIRGLVHELREGLVKAFKLPRDVDPLPVQERGKRTWTLDTAAILGAARRARSCG